MTTPSGPLPTREALHRVCAHVLSRRRQAVAGRIGLRASPGGIATPAFGPDLEVVRLAGGHLVHETAAGTRTVPLAGASLRSLAAFVGEDVDRPVELGPDTPPLGDPDAPLRVDLAPLAAWYARGWAVLDAAIARVGEGSVVQIWPEHFDAATDVPAGAGRVNLGASPGDGSHEAPYFYVGPWDDARPGADGSWTAPFGAVLDGAGADDSAAVDWMLEGVGRFS